LLLIDFLCMYFRMLGPQRIPSCYDRFEDWLVNNTVAFSDTFDKRSSKVSFSRPGLRLVMLSFFPCALSLLSIFIIKSPTFFMVSYMLSFIPIILAICITSPYCDGVALRRVRQHRFLKPFIPIWH
jgi:hypothetical protein